MVSRRGRLLDRALRLARVEETLARDLAAGRTRRHAPSARMKADRDWETCWAQGHPVHRFGPRGRPASDLTYVHLHGGGFVTGLLGQHLRVLARLADLTGAQVITPDYPLPPEDTADAILDYCDRVLRAIDGPLVLGGDSAGATLAILTASRRAACSEPLPKRLLLWSPLCDLRVPGGEGARDGVIEPIGVRAGAARFAGPGGAADPALNPMLADPSGLPPVTIVGGTADPLWPDAERWADRAAAAGVAVDRQAHEGLGHYWMFLPQPEASSTLRQIGAVVTSAA